MNEKSASQFCCPSWQEFPDLELYMDQVISVMERYLAPFFPEEEKTITSTMINNYVKQHLLPSPENKRYGKKHLAYLFVISILKRFMQLSDIHLLWEKLVSERGMEESYGLFKEELEGAFDVVYGGKLPASSRESDPAAQALGSACIAFAAILKARDVFLGAELAPVIPQEAEDEKKLKEEKKKEKKEKKEGKQKEKKEPKEKEEKESK